MCSAASLATGWRLPPGVRVVLVWMRCFQPAAISGGSRERVDAGVMGFQVFPEPQRQRGGQPVQRAVVNAGLPLAQVVRRDTCRIGRQARSYRSTSCSTVSWPGKLELIIRTVGGALYGRRRLHAGADRRTGCAAMPAGCPREQPAAAVQQLHAITRGDVADQAALGRHDQRDPLTAGVNVASPAVPASRSAFRAAIPPGSRVWAISAERSGTATWLTAARAGQAAGHRRLSAAAPCRVCCGSVRPGG